MRELQAKLQAPLGISDIDWRVGMIKQTGTSYGCSLLAYKDSRVDQKRLDDVFGIFGWSVTYQRDTKGILQATVSVYDEARDLWVSKTSNGTESFAESEKGEYSDAFKRACFLWGIGRELYDMPFIWINLADREAYSSQGKARTTGQFRPNEWLWTVDWDYVSKEGYKTGLISAKQGNAWRLKPQPIIAQSRAQKVK